MTLSKKAAALLVLLLPLPDNIVLLVDHLPGHLLEHAGDVPVVFSTALNITSMPGLANCCRNILLGSILAKITFIGSNYDGSITKISG